MNFRRLFRPDADAVRILVSVFQLSIRCGPYIFIYHKGSALRIQLQGTPAACNHLRGSALVSSGIFRVFIHTAILCIEDQLRNSLSTCEICQCGKFHHLLCGVILYRSIFIHRKLCLCSGKMKISGNFVFSASISACPLPCLDSRNSSGDGKFRHNSHIGTARSSPLIKGNLLCTFNCFRCIRNQLQCHCKTSGSVFYVFKYRCRDYRRVTVVSATLEPSCLCLQAFP